MKAYPKFFKRRLTQDERERRDLYERQRERRMHPNGRTGCNCQGPVSSNGDTSKWKTCSHGIMPETPHGNITFCKSKPGHAGHHTWCNTKL